MRLRSLLVGLALALPGAADAQVITFAGTTTDVAPGPTSYSFTFGAPVTLGTFTSVALDLSAMLTLQFGFSGSVSPAGPGGYLLSAYGSLGGGPLVLLGQFGTETCTTSTGTSCAYSPSGGTTIWFPTPTMFDYLEANVSYLSSGGMQYHFEGRAVLSDAPPPTAVPEPATVALLGTGLLVLGGLAAGRRRRER